MKTVKPVLSNKVGDNERINLKEEEKVVSKDKKAAETFQSYFETFAVKPVFNKNF